MLIICVTLYYILEGRERWHLMSRAVTIGHFANLSCSILKNDLLSPIYAHQLM